MSEIRILGIDFGTARLGIALSDPSQTLASPLATIPNDKTAVEWLSQLVRTWNIGAIVVGYPLNLKGKSEISAEKAEQFIAKLQGLKVEVVRWDERFSTHSAVELLQQAGVKPFKEKARIDRSAAAVILQNYLDSRRNSG